MSVLIRAILSVLVWFEAFTIFASVVMYLNRGASRKKLLTALSTISPFPFKGLDEVPMPSKASDEMTNALPWLSASWITSSGLWLPAAYSVAYATSCAAVFIWIVVAGSSANE